MNPKLWLDYEYKKAYSIATVEDLRPVVRKAAKAANQRLLRLERAGATDRGIYKSVTARLKSQTGKTRFKERTQGISDIFELKAEYELLRTFLSAETSTVQGRAIVDRRRYETAKSRGFKGSQTDFYDAVERYFSEVVAQQFSSDVVYDIITSGDDDIIDSVMRKAKDYEQSKGQSLIDYLKAKKEKSGGAKKSRSTSKYKRRGGRKRNK